ncbi:glycosyltransferase family 39 protein, partial [Acetobacter okinawensis]|uniref:ArnT family glycosyltransferase n=1 Tax=Acetobacter okinawensis TaxID=1076594 RepID=UPI001BAB2D11
MLGTSRGTRTLPWRVLLLIALAAFVLFLPGRMSTPPFDRDEPRYMEASAQMLETHNYIDVRFQDKPRYLQPAGIYWLESLAVKAVGMEHARSVWPYRIPSLLAMTAAVVLTALMGASLFGPMAGVGAAVLLMASVLVAAESRMATIDSCLLLIALAAFVLFLPGRMSTPPFDRD